MMEPERKQEKEEPEDDLALESFDRTLRVYSLCREGLEEAGKVKETREYRG